LIFYSLTGEFKHVGNGLLFSFFNIDRVFDFLLSIGMQPLVELSFMPDLLASGNKVGREERRGEERRGEERRGEERRGSY
jgi:hypothetical protein